MEIILTVILTLSSGELFHQEYTQPSYEHCKVKENVMHSSFSKREDVRALITTCGKQYRIIYWIP